MFSFSNISHVGLKKTKIPLRNLKKKKLSQDVINGFRVVDVVCLSFYLNPLYFKDSVHEVLVQRGPQCLLSIQALCNVVLHVKRVAPLEGNSTDPDRFVFIPWKKKIKLNNACTEFILRHSVSFFSQETFNLSQRGKHRCHQ